MGTFGPALERACSAKIDRAEGKEGRGGACFDIVKFFSPLLEDL